MRRTPLALSSLALAAVLGLAGCSGSTSSEASASASAAASAGATVASNVDCSTLTIDNDSSALPAVSGDAGAEPTLSWTGDDAPANLTVKTLSAGSGATVESGDTVVASYAGWQWGSDTTFDSSFSSGSPIAFSLAGVITGWTCGLPGHQVGDRLELSIPATYAYGDSGTSGAPTGTLVFVVDVVDALSADEVSAGTAGATAQDTSALEQRGIAVGGDLGGPATVSVASGAAEPTGIEVHVVAQGTGEPITASSTILTNMAYTSWDGSVAVSSWDLNEPQTLRMSTATQLSGLVGVPIGSRVVILLPADSTTGNPSLAYVMDLEQAL